MNLERYAASRKCYRNRAQSQNHSWGVYEGTYKGLKVRVRRVRAYPEETHRRSRRCALDATFPSLRKLTKPIDLPSGSRNLEALGTSKHRPPLGVTVEPFELISDWMPGGDLLGYIGKHPDVNRVSLVDFLNTLLQGVLKPPQVI